MLTAILFYFLDLVMLELCFLTEETLSLFHCIQCSFVRATFFYCVFFQIILTINVMVLYFYLQIGSTAETKISMIYFLWLVESIIVIFIFSHGTITIFLENVFFFIITFLFIQYVLELFPCANLVNTSHTSSWTSA